jgi:hypothetical protein
VTNSGNIPVSVEDPTITGTNAASFSLAANTCLGVTLQPQQSCVVAVVFRPSTAGQIQAQLTISGGGFPSTIYLTGTGIAVASVSITPGSSALGNSQAPTPITTTVTVTAQTQAALSHMTQLTLTIN